MVQNYPDIPSSKAVRDSRQDLLDRDDAVKSAFSGTTYPSTNLLIGMLCFRTDLGQLFQLTNTSPLTWTRIPLGIPVPVNQGGTGAIDAQPHVPIWVWGRWLSKIPLDRPTSITFLSRQPKLRTGL